MFVFIPIFLVTTFSFSIYKTFFTAEFYENNLVNGAHDFFVSEGQKYIDFAPVADMKKEDFSALAEKIITKEDLKSVVSEIILQMKNLRVGEKGVVELEIPLRWLGEKSSLFSEVITNYLFETLPKCSGMAQNYLEKFDCMPEGLSKEDFSAAFKLALDRKLVSDLPDSFSFKFQIPEQFSNKNIGAFFDELTSKVFFILACVLLFILVIIGLLIFSPKFDVMKWIAKTVFLASLITILVVMVMNVFVPVVFDKLVKSIDVSVMSYNAWMSVYILFVGAFTVNLLKIVFPLSVVGLGFWIVGMIYHCKNNLNDGSTKINTGYKELH